MTTAFWVVCQFINNIAINLDAKCLLWVVLRKAINIPLKVQLIQALKQTL